MRDALGDSACGVQDAGCGMRGMRAAPRRLELGYVELFVVRGREREPYGFAQVQR